jgi:hypothetical protein
MRSLSRGCVKPFLSRFSGDAASRCVLGVLDGFMLLYVRLVPATGGGEGLAEMALCVAALAFKRASS